MLDVYCFLFSFFFLVMLLFLIIVLMFLCTMCKLFAIINKTNKRIRLVIGQVLCLFDWFVFIFYTTLRWIFFVTIIILSNYFLYVFRPPYICNICIHFRRILPEKSVETSPPDRTTQGRVQMGGRKALSLSGRQIDTTRLDALAPLLAIVTGWFRPTY